MGRIVKLIMVTPDNNNKVYELRDNGDGTCTALWGRVGAGMQETKYAIGEFDKKLKEKIKKGYKDITELLSVEKDVDEPELQITGVSQAVRDLINFLQNTAKGVVKKNYTVKVADVTEKQIEAAQAILDHLAVLSQGTWSRDSVNKDLIELYSVVPRKMGNTKDFLLQATDTAPKFQKLLSNEVDLLDILRGQVKTTIKKTSTGTELKLDIVMREATPEELAHIRKTTDLDFSKVGKVFAVSNPKTEGAYISHFATPRSSELLLYHGSRNENWWSIINNGLLIRPSNAIHTGSMFGDGIYFANKARKSIGYTSLSGSYWASGSSNKAYLALYGVNVGSMWDVLGKSRYGGSMSSLSLSKVRSAGYDTVFARGGADLRNDEHIIYEAPRCTIKYLIELKG